MKILIVSHYFASHGGGIEYVARHLAEEWLKSGHEVAWAATNLNEGFPGNVKTIPMRGTNLIEKIFGTPYPLWGPKSIRKLKGAIAWADWIHIHEGFYFGNQIAFRFARKNKKPIILTQHIGDIPFKNIFLRFFFKLGVKIFTEKMIANASEVVFVSQVVADFFSKMKKSGNVSVIYNGLDSELFKRSDRPAKKLKTELGFSPNRPLFLFVGRFVAKKGLDKIRELTIQKKECQMVLVGKGPINPKQWGLPNVTVIPTVEQAQLPKWYQACDLFLLPSVGEGFPLVIQEALACGAPCLVLEETKRACPRAGEFLFNYDLKTIQKLQEENFGDSDFRKKISEFARREWSWEKAAKSYEEIFIRQTSQNSI